MRCGAGGFGGRSSGWSFAVSLPSTYLAGRDLANFPARIGWLFNYDYVNVPNVGRPWPLTNLYGDRYEYGQQVFFYTALATVAVLVFAACKDRFRFAAAVRMRSLRPGSSG